MSERHYTAPGGHVLGYRCDKGHSGNTRFYTDGKWSECAGCGNLRGLEGHASRAEAERAERAFTRRPAYPDDAARASVDWLIRRGGAS